MNGLIISTDHLISSSEARSKFGKLLGEITENEKNYFVILENGKVTALLVHPNWLKENNDEQYPDLEKLRQDWSRYQEEISNAMENLENIEQDKLPKLLK